MTKLALGSHPFLLGFERLERLVERTAKSDGGGYPPYNIERISETGYRISIAVAGFAREDLSITVEDRQLVVRGQIPEPAAERTFLYRGIASRRFERTFLLADGVDIAGANMRDGLLDLELMRLPAEQVVRTIEISKARDGRDAGVEGEG